MHKRKSYKSFSVL